MRKAYFLHRDWVAALFFWQYTIVLEESDVCKARITTAARQKRSVVPFIFEWCCAADRADVCWGQWGREEKVAVVPELNRCMIKRSQGHIKRRTKSGGLYVSALEHGGAFFFLFLFLLPCVYVCMCFQQLPRDEREHARWAQPHDVWLSASRGWWTGGDVPEMWVSVGAEQTDRQTVWARREWGGLSLDRSAVDMLPSPRLLPSAALIQLSYSFYCLVGM